MTTTKTEPVDLETPEPPESSQGEAGDNKPPKLAEQVACLIEANAEVELFHDPSDTAWAIIPTGKRRACVRLTSRTMRAWISRTARAALGSAPSPATVDGALVILDATARFDGPERPVHLRVAEHEGAIVLDLGDDAGACVVVKPDGWALSEEAPVMFQRPRAMRPLPRPERGGSVRDLGAFVNLDEQGLHLLLAWLVAAYRPGRPCPALALTGEQGTAKSTTAKLVRSLVDPNSSPLRTVPRAEDDLLVAAQHSYVVAFDNLSGVAGWLSDALCRLVTGGGLSKRTLYTDDEETVLEAIRPIVVNGIDDLANRPDLAERCLMITLEPIPDEKRRDEVSFWREFAIVAPRIMGVLLDGVASALQRVGATRLAKLPRMADFAQWISAAEPGLRLAPGTLLRAYETSMSRSVDVALNASPVASAVRELLARAPKGQWTGSPTDLLDALRQLVSDAVARNPAAWPVDPHGLGMRLRRAASFLRSVGIHFHEHPGRARGRQWTLLTLPPPGPRPRWNESSPFRSSQPASSRQWDGWDAEDALGQAARVGPAGQEGAKVGLDAEDAGSANCQGKAEQPSRRLSSAALARAVLIRKAASSASQVPHGTNGRADDVATSANGGRPPETGN